MALTAQPLNFIDVNHFSFAERMELQQGNGGVYYFQILRAESVIVQPQGPTFGFLGAYAEAQVVSAPIRYIPAAGSTVILSFPRSPSIAPTPINQDVNAAATAVTGDTSIYFVTLSAAQVNTIVSEGVKLVITESGITSTWPVDSFVRRRSNIPGA